MQKYDFDEVWLILECVFVCEIVVCVVLGVIVKVFFKQFFGIELFFYVVFLGFVLVLNGLCLDLSDLICIDVDLVWCVDLVMSKCMVVEIEVCCKEGDILGGVVEVLVYGLLVGLGLYSQGD